MIAWSSLIRWVNGCGPEAKPADSFVGCNISQKRMLVAPAEVVPEARNGKRASSLLPGWFH